MSDREPVAIAVSTESGHEVRLYSDAAVQAFRESEDYEVTYESD